MRRRILPVTVLLSAFLIFVFQLSAQTGNAPLDKVATKLQGNNWIKFKSSQNVDPLTFLEEYKSSFGLDEKSSFRLVRKQTDRLGFTHYRYQQYHNEVKVEGGEYIIHAKNGRAVKANGYIISGINVAAGASVTPQQAIDKVMARIQADEYAWQNEAAEATLKDIKNDPSATFYPQPDLVYVNKELSDDGEQFRLAYKFDVYATQPLSRKYWFVNAVSGEIYHSIDRIHTGDVTATAVTKYSGNQTIITDSVSPASYRLREAGRGGGIETYNMQEGTDYNNAVDFTDSDNYWNNFNSDQDEAATDAHWATEMAYDYFMIKHGRNSYDGNGSKMISYVHYDQDYANAFWNGSWMTYGDGDGTNYTALTSLDVGGHEIAHGVTETSANLVYQDEPGALNESFSDIFGAAVEFYADSANGDWYVGEDFDQNGNGFRNMQNPNSNSDPDTYGGLHWYTGNQDNGGVHTNSGVQNYWFYLLVDGGAGTNDHGNNFSINALGLDTAAAIAYRNLTVYLTQNAQYIDARMGAIQSAEDLYGACSNPAVQTANAWFAVGVGTPVVDNDVWMMDVSSPASGCGLSNAETVTVEMRYNGCNANLSAGDTIALAYRVDGGTIVNDTTVLAAPVSGGDTISFTFSTPGDFSTTGTHTVDAWLSFNKDTVTFNDSLMGYQIENKLQQNIDVGLVGITSPVTACQLTSAETVGVQVAFFGCDSLSAGDSIAVAYRLNGGAPVTDYVVLSSPLYPRDTVYYSFPVTADFSAAGTYTLDAWTAFNVDTMNANDSLLGYEVKNPEILTDESFIPFENNVAVLDSMIMTSGSEASVKVSTDAKRHGNYGLQMTGGDPLNYSGDIVIPDGNNNWLVNEDFGAKTCFCVDASGWATAELRFDLKQTFSSIYALQFGQPVPEASSLRVLANGTQIGGTYNPTTETSDPFVRHHVNLDAYAGGMIEVCFETRMGFSDNADFLSDGDNAYLDNIFASEISTVGFEENSSDQRSSSASVYPNPNEGRFTIAYHAQENSTLQLSVVNILGEQVHQKQWEVTAGQNTYELTNEKLTPGVYFVRLNEEQSTKTVKVIVK